MKSLNRRSFLKSTALTTAAFSLPARSWAQVNGSNSDVRVAVIGCGGRGSNHISEWAKMSGVRLTALCDADASHAAGHAQQLDKAGKKVETFTDLRKLLENKNIDAVSIATPNHWHSLAGIWAIQAGKDVYTEKPVSHNVWEGRQFVNAARAHKKIVQTGTQSRSSVGGIGEAVAWVKEGHIGKILVARGLCYKPRVSIGKVPGPQTPPPELNYDLWSGPAEILPVMRKKFHYDWHWFWAYGNGDLGNQGIHQMDIARWFLGEMELAPAVISIGGRFGYADDGETPNTEIVFQGYEKAPLIFEVRGLPKDKSANKNGAWGSKDMDRLKGADIGVIVECEGGYVVVPSYTQSTAYDKKGQMLKKFTGSENHFQNFIKGVLSRRKEDLNADILEGHLSSALCHTGNISYRLGSAKNPDEIREGLKDDKGMVESFERMAAHLEKNEVDITKDKVALGVPLKMDTKTERFVGNEKANGMLARNYRAPYIVPGKV
jgi:predicted dehydrogenase